ncbi:MAG TPA: GntR family transcriptional regulator [Actinomycetes bacterium]|nr:GntR family transcriptional regulator [Actinomycetes bacterium]
MRSLETVSVVDALTDDIERRVLNGELTPGEHLREVELAEEYQVGRHTLRAAFDGLVGRGLVQRERNRGVFVRVLDRDDLTEIYQLRIALEVEAFRTLAERRRVPPDAARAAALLLTLDAQSAQRDFVEADLAFHSAIVEGAGNDRLARVHESLRAEIRLLLAQLVNRYASVRELAKEHRDLLAAIENGDPVAAEAAIRGHLGRATVWLAEHAVTRPRPPAAST